MTDRYYPKGLVPRFPLDSTYTCRAVRTVNTPKDCQNGKVRFLSLYVKRFAKRSFGSPNPFVGPDSIPTARQVYRALLCRRT